MVKTLVEEEMDLSHWEGSCSWTLKVNDSNPRFPALFVHPQRLTAAVAESSARCAGDPVQAATVGWTPGQHNVEGRLSALPSQHSCRLVGACLAFVCTARTEIIAHVKDPRGTY